MPENSKRQIANRMAALFLVLFVAAGLLLIYRSSQDLSQLPQFEAIVTSLKLDGGHGNYGRNYAVLIGIEGKVDSYGIYSGTKEHAEKSRKTLEIQVGQKYKFFVDPTVATSGGTNLGIRRIEFEDEPVYVENMKSHKVFGLVFIVLGIVSSSLIYLIAKKKFK